ncbi:hypothetical protein F5148DRAFT_816688 [Russula earlei]|uniref:Uncharacterized protein n=1 Tax=Russula earlei TaxID=71964 RepID=A0ACC0UC25_9AGAM|nr:hypothetical protein F5148DRAFT_816688 [Russula earlei]
MQQGALCVVPSSRFSCVRACFGQCRGLRVGLQSIFLLSLSLPFPTFLTSHARHHGSPIHKFFPTRPRLNTGRSQHMGRQVEQTSPYVLRIIHLCCASTTTGVTSSHSTVLSPPPPLSIRVVEKLIHKTGRTSVRAVKGFHSGSDDSETDSLPSHATLARDSLKSVFASSVTCFCVILAPYAICRTKEHGHPPSSLTVPHTSGINVLTANIMINLLSTPA